MLLNIKKKDNILFCAYRNWGLKIYNNFKKKNICNFLLAKNENQFYQILTKHKPIIIVLLGWSWILKKEVVNNFYVVGIHPSDLPDYAGGSPIQNQIIGGLTSSKCTLFKISQNVDKGPILGKTNLSLDGNIEEVFNSIYNASIYLLEEFFNNFPNIKEISQKNDIGQSYKRLRPEDSDLSKKLINKTSCKNLYNLIRCRTAPYPNAFIKDETGTLYFENVRFVKNEQK